MCVVQMHASRVSMFSRVMWVLGFYSGRAKLLLRAFASLVQLKFQKVCLWSFNLQSTFANMSCTKSYSMWLNYMALLILCPIFTLFSFCLWKIPWAPVYLCFLSSSLAVFDGSWVLFLCWNLSCISNFVFMYAECWPSMKFYFQPHFCVEAYTGIFI